MKKHNTQDKLTWAICVLACIIADKIAIEHDISLFITVIILEIISVFVIMFTDNL